MTAAEPSEQLSAQLLDSRWVVGWVFFGQNMSKPLRIWELFFKVQQKWPRHANCSNKAGYSFQSAAYMGSLLSSLKRTSKGPAIKERWGQSGV